MSKSPYVIAALGVGACLALSLLMRELTDMGRNGSKSPVERQLEAKFRSQLAAPVRVREERAGDAVRVVATTVVGLGLDKRRFADTLGAELWPRLRSAGSRPTEVVVVVKDVAGGVPLSHSVPEPAPAR